MIGLYKRVSRLDGFFFFRRWWHVTVVDTYHVIFECLRCPSLKLPKTAIWLHSIDPYFFTTCRPTLSFLRLYLPPRHHATTILVSIFLSFYRLSIDLHVRALSILQWNSPSGWWGSGTRNDRSNKLPWWASILFYMGHFCRKTRAVPPIIIIKG